MEVAHRLTTIGTDVGYQAPAVGVVVSYRSRHSAHLDPDAGVLGLIKSSSASEPMCTLGMTRT